MDFMHYIFEMRTVIKNESLSEYGIFFHIFFMKYGNNSSIRVGSGSFPSKTEIKNAWGSDCLSYHFTLWCLNTIPVFV